MSGLANLARAALFGGAIASFGLAQLEATPIPTTGLAGETFAARLREGPGLLLLVTAHPDDEDNAVAAMLRWTYGVRVVLWTMTRGEGGQNEIGPEQGEALKLLRDGELEAAHRFDGIEQFRRADVPDMPDFGYSFSVDETFRIWQPKPAGRGSCRRVLQAVKPDVVVTMAPDGDGGGMHHQASARLMLEECALETNPWREDGLSEDGEPWWRPLKVYASVRTDWLPPGASRPAVRPDAEAAADSRPIEEVAVDGVDPWIGRDYRRLAAEARSMHKSQGMSRLLDPFGPATRRFRLMIDRTGEGAAATRPQRGEAPLFARVPKRPRPDAYVAAPPPPPRAFTDVAFATPGETIAAKDKDGRAMEIVVPLDAPTDGSYVVEGLECRSAGDVFSGEQRDPVFVVPPWSATFDLDLIAVPRPVGSKPGLPRPVVLRVRRDAPTTAFAEFESATFEIVCDDPNVDYRFPTMAVRGATRGETFDFQGTVAAKAGAARRSKLSVVVYLTDGRGTTVDGATTLRTVDYPHIRRRVLVEEAACVVAAFDLADPPPHSRPDGGAARPKVLFVRGVGEESDRYLRTLDVDAEVVEIGRDVGLKRLSDYDVIVIGARAFEFRDDLGARRAALRRYVEDGGVMIVQYQKAGAPFDLFAPYKASIASRRATDEAGPVEILEPTHPVFTTPNAIGPSDFVGWVKDRSLYHLEPGEGAREAYRELALVHDTFGSNVGPKPGAFVEARVGRGRWIYCGLALWRQLPEGVEGAWRLFSNLLALRGDPP
jgi:LmbE family N-acetylglucosaminyl deacetylase